MPIYDFRCPNEHCENSSEKGFESLSKPYEPVKCPLCGTYPVERLLTAHGGYQINGDNSASRRPKGAGSFRSKK